MRWLRRHTKVVLTILLVIIVAALFAAPAVYQHRWAIIQSPLVGHFVPLYRSLRKLPDVLFFPVTLAAKSELETFEVTISPSNIQAMNAALPQDPFGTAALEERHKKWVPAHFTAADYSGNVDVRYRGFLNNHWNSYQKSYLVQFPRNNLFRGMRELTLIIPSDRRYFTTALNSYRAEKLGLKVADVQYVKVNVNGADHGVYIALEHWSQEWLEKEAIDPASIIFGTPNDVSLDNVLLHSEEGLRYWQTSNVDETPAVFESGRAIVEIVEHADTDSFKKLVPRIVDLDAFYARDVLGILAGGYHWSNSVNANNARQYFDAIEGRFKPLPFNISLFEPSVGDARGTPTDLQRRIWEISEYKEARDALLATYIEENEEDDLAFLERWKQEFNMEFLKDNAKAGNNIAYLSKMDTFVDIVAQYMKDPPQILLDPQFYGTYEADERPMEFTDSFVYLPQTIVSPAEFVRAHPEFILQNGEIVLPAGSYFFGEDIIIPADTKLTLSAGTTLFMGEEVSLISYSPVVAKGTATFPIRFIPAQTGVAWGVFAVINTENKRSIFDYIHLSDGKDDKINGVYFSGMLAMHNAAGSITNSRFENAHADDGVNIKKSEVRIENSVFEDNASDGLDVDFARDGTIVQGSQFLNNKGDAIDLSWSDVRIQDNVIVDCFDKGVSVGEQSSPTISENIIVRCNIGIAVKDSSRVIAVNNIFMENSVAVAAFQKKPIYGGGTVDVARGTFWKNARETKADALSSITMTDVGRIEPNLGALSGFLREKILQ